MSEIKQVKVDNWGIYFLQRLKHFFNRTDYCDLTLQFQDNAQLKVHRLVLSACTEYFELLERTCEMYEECLVMPDDLQADVVVPIVNFMYTGQLEFRMDMLEKFYQTSLVMNMPVLSKLLDAHRMRAAAKRTTSQSFINSQRRNSRMDSVKQLRHTPSPSHITPVSHKRSYSNAFQNASTPKSKVKTLSPQVQVSPSGSKSPHRALSPIEVIQNNKRKLKEPRPTRYELPEALDTDNIFENSFSNISYTSAPLMVHPETTKHYPSKKDSQLHKKLMKTATMEIVECKKIKSDTLFEDDVAETTVRDESDMFPANLNESPKDTNQLFDQMLDSNETAKVVIETKGDKQASNIDHAKIISEVLKKYPHLVKSNKNIKLKILNTPSSSKIKKDKLSSFIKEKEVKPEPPDRDYTYETDVIDSKEAAKLIAMGAENIKGPWICLICGTPGRALHFTSYYKFRRHLVEIHNEKCIPTICEYCGFKSYKRNFMVHHCYTKHGVQPPPHFSFPKCNYCDFVAVTEGYLVKHKMAQHSQETKQFRCNVCIQSFHTYNKLLQHIQKTGHKFSDRKANQQCIYCLKVFQRESNLIAHLKTNHKLASKRDGIIEDSDEEKEKSNVKQEGVSYDDESEDGDVHYQIQQRSDGLHVITKKSNAPSLTNTNRQKILNPGFRKPSPVQPQKTKPVRTVQTVHNEFLQDQSMSNHNTVINNENVIEIDNVEYVMRDNELIPRKTRNEFVIPDMIDQEQSYDSITPSTSMEFANIQSTENAQQIKMIVKKSNSNQPIQIVVSNEEEYKALMSSNHSIIFDDDDTNKTLTMMTDSQNTTLDTSAIDLESTQSNDMMIIQDDYPLNVSEAVPTDNNIVVVYSHAVGQISDPNKQYQIITSQDIGAQFIQSSAMITQNFETVTTSTPVMSANVINAEIHETWQNDEQPNMENQHLDVTSNVKLESMSTNKDASESLEELPEVEITTVHKETPTEPKVHESVVLQSNINVEELNQDAPDQSVTENSESVAGFAITPMDTDDPCSMTPNKEVVSTEFIIAKDEIGITPISENNLIQVQSEPSMPQTNIASQEELSEAQELIENPEAHDKPVGNNCDESDEQMVETQPDGITTSVCDSEETAAISKDDIAQTYIGNTTNLKPAVIKVTKEQIQSLTSEWSDDEYEVPEDSTVLKETPTSITQKITLEAEPKEIEESIENIQQEVDKSLTQADESMDSTLNDSASSELKDADATIIPQEPPVPEKLSSLLNDWEDNDSQDENNESENVIEGVTEMANTEVIIAQAENGDVIETDAETNLIDMPCHVAENVEELEQDATAVTKKDDKIKSLVSDWDDDEEEKE